MLCFIRRHVCKSKLSFFLLLTAKYILMNQDMLCFIRRRVCKSKLSFFLLLTAKYILILCLWMRRGRSDFLSFFKFFTTCLVPCVLFSITCPLAKEMSSILTTAYCPQSSLSAFQLNKCSTTVTESILSCEQPVYNEHQHFHCNDHIKILQEEKTCKLLMWR